MAEHSSSTLVKPTRAAKGRGQKAMAEKKPVNWSSRATRLLITSWASFRPQLKNIGPKKMYTFIADDLRKKGYAYKGEHCATKWHSLRSFFIKHTETALQRDAAVTWIYYDDMVDALEIEHVCRTTEGEVKGKGKSKRTSSNDVNESTSETLPQDSDSDTEIEDGADNDDINDNDDSNVGNDNKDSDAEESGDDDNSSDEQDNDGDHESDTSQSKHSFKATKRETKISQWQKNFSQLKEEWRRRREERQQMHKERMELGYGELCQLQEMLDVYKNISNSSSSCI